MTDRELMQQALEALNRSDYLGWQLNIPIIKALRERLAQPEQQAEPTPWRDMVVVSLVREGVNKHKARELADHFATPPQRTWVGLTEWEREAIAHACGAMGAEWLVFIEAVEKALKERNT